MAEAIDQLLEKSESSEQEIDTEVSLFGPLYYIGQGYNVSC